MIRLEVLKKSYFLDYKNVERYLSQARVKHSDEEVINPVRTVSLINKTN